MNKKVYFVIIVMIITLALTILLRSHYQDIVLQGEVDAPNITVVSKAKGRVIDISVLRGSDVKVGDRLLTLESPELAAQVKALEAARDQAKAQVELSKNGTREESLRYYQSLLDQAKATYDNAQKAYARNLKVFQKGYISRAALDEAKKNRDAAYDQMQAAQANLEQAQHGDRQEQRAIYQAKLQQAEDQLQQLMVQYDDLIVKAPVDGEVATIAADVGELFNAQSPLLTLTRLSQAYFIFNLREDILASVHKGDKVTLVIPALGNQKVEAEVRYISPMGDFATKRATRATGDFDLKTFEVRLYPLQPVPNLRAGMSVLWRWSS